MSHGVWSAVTTRHTPEHRRQQVGTFLWCANVDRNDKFPSLKPDDDYTIRLDSFGVFFPPRYPFLEWTMGVDVNVTVVD